MSAGAQPEIFQSRGDFVKLGDFDKHFVKNARKKKKNHRETFWSFFSNILLKLHFNEKFNSTMDTISATFFQIRKIFNFQKRKGETHPPSSMVAHLWVWLTMHQYLWISRNVLENAWINCSDYARALKMPGHLTCFDWLLKMPRVLNVLEFWICHCCKC